MSRARAALLLTFLLVTTATAQARADATGLQLSADNTATAATAASAAPLVASEVQGHTIALPAGFHIAVIASGLKAPRFMQFDDAGNLLVADAQAGAILRFVGNNGSPGGPATSLIEGLDAPSNVALHDGYLYVGETSAISRYAYDPQTGVGARQVVVPSLPTGGHSTRTIAFGPDGAMYVSVGSSCNICNESDERRAAVLRFAADGSGYERFASGLRNAVGLTIQPGTGLLWATVNERDNQGNEIPPDLVTIVGQGERFGWPLCQPPTGRPQDPGNDCSDITPPTVAIQAHSAPLGLAFYTGQQFPPDYANDLFVVQHGSWNRQPPAPPKLLHIHFEGDQPVSAMDFATGWQADDGSRWGRPAGITVAPDGSLIVSDDQAGLLYRISYAS